jgi:hypothetical protein
VAKFKYLGTTVSNKNLNHEGIRSRLNLGNACYHSVQKVLSSRLLHQNVHIKMYKTTILPVVLYGCESWYHIIREEHRLNAFEKKKDYLHRRRLKRQEDAETA